MKGRLFVALAVALTVAAFTAAPTLARAESPQAIARQILGHAPQGLAKKIVERGSILVANDANYPPQSFYDPHTRKLRGFDVDVAKRVGRILGLRVVFRNPAWEYVPKGLRRGLYDVSIGSMEITPERQAILGFTAPYYYSAAQVIVKKGGPRIRGVGSLFGKRVGVGRDTTYQAFLEQYPQIRLRTFVTDADAFPALAAGKLKFVLTSWAVGRQAIKYGQPFEFSGKPLFHDRLAFALRQGQPDLQALLNYTIWRMHRSGALRKMSLKWYRYNWSTWHWRR